MSPTETIGPIPTAELLDVEPLIRVEGLSAGFQSKVVVHEASLEVPERGIFGLMGPAGVGKSTLLRTLGRWNDALPSFWVRGKVELAGEDLLREMPLEEARRRVPLLAQKARLYTATVLENAIAAIRGEQQLTLWEKRDLAYRALSSAGLWDELEPLLNEPVLTLSIAQQRMLSMARLLAGGAVCLLADEPLRDVPREDALTIARFLRRLSRQRAVLMTTHDQRAARELFDSVCLLVAGKIEEVAPRQVFFSEPKSPLTRQFIKTGNCWPTEPEAEGADLGEELEDVPVKPEPVRPGAFHWVLMGQLAGMQRPGLLKPEEQDLAALARLGCRVLVTLTEEPYDVRKLEPLGIRGFHFPIPDMGVPSFQAALTICRDFDTWIESDLPTVLHCKAGLGRTGTMLACLLVYRGENGVQAIDRVRSVNRYYIQSPEQLAFVGEFARRLGR